MHDGRPKHDPILSRDKGPILPSWPAYGLAEGRIDVVFDPTGSCEDYTYLKDDARKTTNLPNSLRRLILFIFALLIY